MLYLFREKRANIYSRNYLFKIIYMLGVRYVCMFSLCLCVFIFMLCIYYGYCMFSLLCFYLIVLDV